MLQSQSLHQITYGPTKPFSLISRKLFLRCIEQMPTKNTDVAPTPKQIQPYTRCLYIIATVLKIKQNFLGIFLFGLFYSNGKYFKFFRYIGSLLRVYLQSHEISLRQLIFPQTKAVR